MYITSNIFVPEKTKRGGVRAPTFNQSSICRFIAISSVSVFFPEICAAFIGNPALSCLMDNIMLGIQAQDPHQISQIGFDRAETNLQPGANIGIAGPLQD